MVDTGSWLDHQTGSIMRQDRTGLLRCFGAATQLTLTAGHSLAHIGDNFNHNDVPGSQNNQIFKGLIDWIRWLAVADYSGVDDPPS